MKLNETFQKRLEKCYDELKWLYMELYDEASFGYFVGMLERMYNARSDALKEWDDARQIVPDWYRGNDMLGIMLYADHFAGGLSGVEEHLDYLEELGINYLHLMPLLDAPKGKDDGGYAVRDFKKVNPRLGTMKDLKALTRACHDKGMVVCLDFVMNHTSDEHAWAKKAKEGDPTAMSRYFFYDNWDIPNMYEETMPQVFPQSAPGNFSWCEEVGKVVMTTFYPYQWDLNYYNPMVFNDMTENMLFLCNQGVDVIRLDAVPYIWKEPGTSCRNLPRVHTLCRMLHLAADIVCPGTLLLGEVVMEPSKVVPYFGTPDQPECQMLYNVTTMATTWHTVACRDVRLLKHQMGIVSALPREDTFLNYLRCHDDLGWGLDYDFLRNFGMEEVAHKAFLNDYFIGRLPGSDSRGVSYNDDPAHGDARLCGTAASFCGVEAAEYEGDKEKRDRGICLDLMLHAFLLTQSGIPLLYSGDEIAQLNDYSYEKDPELAGDTRNIHRSDFSWKDAAGRKGRDSRQGKMYRGLRKLIDIRKREEVFSSQADVWVVETYNDKVLGIGRYYKKKKLIALFNFSDYDEVAWIDEPEAYKNLLTKKKQNASGVTVGAHDFIWMMTEYR